jgi:hypothetical protein
LRVFDLGVKLHAIYFTLWVLKGSDCARSVCAVDINPPAKFQPCLRAS